MILPSSKFEVEGASGHQQILRQVRFRPVKKDRDSWTSNGLGSFVMQTLSRCVNRRRTPVGRYSSLFTTRLDQSESCWGRVARSVFAVSCRQDVSVVGSREAEWWGGGGSDVGLQAFPGGARLAVLAPSCCGAGVSRAIRSALMINSLGGVVGEE